MGGGGVGGVGGVESDIGGGWSPSLVEWSTNLSADRHSENGKPQAVTLGLETFDPRLSVVFIERLQAEVKPGFSFSREGRLKFLDEFGFLLLCIQMKVRAD